MRVSFTHKVLAAIGAIILVLLAGVLFFFNLRSNVVAEGEVTRRLNRTESAFLNYMDATRQKLVTVNSYISGSATFNAYMVEAIDSGSTSSVQDQFEEIQRFSGAEFMIVLDGYGELVVDTSEAIAADAGESLQAFIEEMDRRLEQAYAEAEQSAELEEPTAEESLSSVIGVLRSGADLYQVVMSVLEAGDYIAGYVLVGYAITNQDAEDIGRITNCDLLIIADDESGPQLVARYFEDASGIDDQVLLSELPRTFSGQFDIHISGEVYRGIGGPLLAPGDFQVGRYSTVKSMRKETEPFRKMRNGMLLIGLLALVVIAPLTMAAARKVTMPVNQLHDAINLARDGQYDETKIHVESNDEIGAMAGAFKSMVRELREQRELIEFLEASAFKTDDAPTQIKREGGPDSATVALTQSTGTMRTMQTGTLVRQAAKDGKVLPRGFVLANRYEIINDIGRGGMGIVYRAQDRSLDEVVAIKMLHFDRGDLADMLKQETKLARRVTHRNILRIFDLGELDDLYFISMEYVEGTTVKTLLKRHKQLPTSVGLLIARQVCLGLSAAHEAGVIHGDIKPENIIINGRGEVKVMDFGVARVANVEIGQGEMVSGTPRYMPPEQFQGQATDNRSDIYSFGIMLYELFAGEAPFHAANLTDLFMKHVNEPIPELGLKNPSVPTELQGIITKAAAKRSDDRYPNVQAVLAALKRLG